MTGRTPTLGDLLPRRRVCSSCPAPVVWAVTASRKAIPVNPTPSNTGNLLLELQPVEGQPDHLVAHTLRRNQISGARAAGQLLYRTHFTDCPRAAQHRRPRR